VTIVKMALGVTSEMGIVFALLAGLEFYVMITVLKALLEKIVGANACVRMTRGAIT